MFLVALAGLRIAFGSPLTVDKLSAKAPLGAATLLAGAAALGHVRRRATASPATGLAGAVGPVLADWLPVILCLLVYENMHDAVRLIRPDTLDAPLATADAWLFGGVQPTIWLQRWTTRGLVDLMAVAYSSYFFTPTILGMVLYAGGRRREFRELMLVLITTFYLGFLGYILVPAVGPIHWLRDAYTAPPVLQGYVYDAAEALMNEFRSINRDCFPSLHTAVGTITLVYAWRTRHLTRPGPLLAAVYLPLTLALWFSTVYLRYHWVVDVLAGWALAATTIALAPKLLPKTAPAHGPRAGKETA